jgi:hypothetical protein
MAERIIVVLLSITGTAVGIEQQLVLHTFVRACLQLQQKEKKKPDPQLQQLCCAYSTQDLWPSGWLLLIPHFPSLRDLSLPTGPRGNSCPSHSTCKDPSAASCTN